MTTPKRRSVPPTTSEGEGVAGAPERADDRGAAQGALAADDGGHGDDVIGIGGVAHPEEEPEHEQ
jgi:hypothetical protein